MLSRGKDGGYAGDRGTIPRERVVDARHLKLRQKGAESDVERDTRSSRVAERRSLVVMLTILLVSVGLSGCLNEPGRRPVPLDLAAEARIERVELARIWGDRVTPDLHALVDRQFRQTRAAVATGARRSAALRQVDFLAISGGGADGAYAAGLLVGWTARGNRPEFEVVTGVSTGALAAPFAFLGPSYDSELTEVFTQHGDADIYTDLGVVGLMGKGLYDNSPLRRLIDRYLTEQVVAAIANEYRRGRRLLVQTTNIDAERPVIWDVTAIAASDRADRKRLISDVLLASSAMPVVFPPVRIAVEVDGDSREELHVDGGTVAQVFFAPPDIGLEKFERRNLGSVRSRHLYLVRNGRLEPQYKATEEGPLAIARRAMGTLVKYQAVSDLTRIGKQAAQAGARFSYASIPPGFLEAPKSEFDRDYMRKLFEVGRQDGRSGSWRSTPPATPILAANNAPRRHDDGPLLPPERPYALVSASPRDVAASPRSARAR